MNFKLRRYLAGVGFHSALQHRLLRFDTDIFTLFYNEHLKSIWSSRFYIQDSATIILMTGRRVDELRDELSRLMTEHIASVKTQTFGGLDDIALRIQELRLRKIREVAADYLAALKAESS